MLTFEGDAMTPGDCAGHYTINPLSPHDALPIYSATCTQTITVNDTTAPSITCPGPVTVQCEIGRAHVCTPVTVRSHNWASAGKKTFEGDAMTPGDCAGHYTITRTYKGADACGNS